MNDMKKEHLKGSIYLFFAFTLAGTSVISARYVSNQLGTFTITTVSLFFAILCLLPLCRKNLFKILKQLERRDLFLLILQAMFGIFMFRMFLLRGLLLTSTGEAGILTGATPAVTTLLAWLVLKEQIYRRSFAGILSTISGILLIQEFLLPGSEFVLEHFLGNILVLCAAISESLFNILSRISNLKAASYHKAPIDPITQTMLVSCIALFLCAIPSIFEHPILSLTSLGIKEWLALVWYGVFVTAFAFIFWFSGIKRCSAHVAAAFSGMMPFTSLILSVIILGEDAGWQQWTGGSLIILGMFLLGKRKSA